MRIEYLSYIYCIKNEVIKKEPKGSLVEKLVFHFFIEYYYSTGTSINPKALAPEVNSANTA